MKRNRKVPLFLPPPSLFIVNKINNNNGAFIKKNSDA